MQQYLARYLEPEAQSLSVTEHYLQAEYCLVVPIFDETIESISSLVRFCQSVRQQILLILIFNAPKNAHQDQVLQTVACMHWAMGQMDEARLIIIDRVTQRRVDVKQGVGLARKIGLDIAIKIHAAKLIEGEGFRWLHMTDADAELPEDYFLASQTVDSDIYSALVYPFRHRVLPDWEIETALYDLSLRYYVEMLAQAGSPYAFYTIGSVLAISPEAYAHVRGVPKRAGAEDFYLLNKLAKVKPVKSLCSSRVLVDARPSSRVPFGTGPGLLKLRDMDSPVSDYLYYHPHTFDCLKRLLDHCLVSELPPTREDTRQFIQSQSSYPSGDFFVQSIADLAIEELVFSLEDQRFNRARWSRQFNQRFDGFKTLRFIHTMRDLGLQSIPLTTLSRYHERFSKFLTNEMKQALITCQGHTRCP